MSRRSRLVAGFLLLSTSLCFAPTSVNAQVGVGYNKVVSCVESQTGNSIVLRMAQRKVPYKPVVQYLPGANGSTLLVADFPGLVFPLGTKIIRPAMDSGIQEIHVGQFQDSPAISRVTLIAPDGNALKDVAFHAEPGLLQVKWPAKTSAKHWTLVPAVQQPLLVAQQPQRAVPGELKPVPQRFVAPQQLGLSLQPNSQQPNPASAAKPPAQPKPTPVAPKPKSLAPKPTPLAPKPTPVAPQPAPDRRTSSLKGFSAASKALSTSETSKPNEDVPAQSSSTSSSTKGFLTGLMSKVKGAFSSDEDAPSDEAPPQAPSKVVRKTPEAAPTIASSSEQASTESGDSNVPPPTIEVIDTSADGDTTSATSDSSSKGNVVVKLKSTHPFSAKSFRISDPERYVVDFADLPELTGSELPSFPQGPLLKSIRVGAPESGKTRLVLDLSGLETSVREMIDGNSISLIVDRQKVAALPAVGNFNASGLTVMLDAGHGGSDPGAQRGDIQEKEITLGIVKQLKRVLESRGARVLLTRQDDTFVSLEDRVSLTNSAGPTVFLSVHINALESTSDIHGIETYYQTEQSRALADSVHNSLVTNLQAPDRSVRKARFYVINHTPVPAVLAEVGFISNKDERTKLISSDYQQQVAEALAQGVMLYAKSRPDIALAKPDVLPGANSSKTARLDERSKLLPKSFSPIAQTERTTR